MYVNRLLRLVYNTSKRWLKTNKTISTRLRLQQQQQQCLCAINRCPSMSRQESNTRNNCFVLVAKKQSANSRCPSMSRQESKTRNNGFVLVAKKQRHQVTWVFLNACYDRSAPSIFWGSSLEELHTPPKPGLEKNQSATPRAQVFMGKKRKTQNDIPAIQLLGTSSVATVEESR